MPTHLFLTWLGSRPAQSGGGRPLLHKVLHGWLGAFRTLETVACCQALHGGQIHPTDVHVVPRKGGRALQVVFGLFGSAIGRCQKVVDQAFCVCGHDVIPNIIAPSCSMTPLAEVGLVPTPTTGLLLHVRYGCVQGRKMRHMPSCIFRGCCPGTQVHVQNAALVCLGHVRFGERCCGRIWNQGCWPADQVMIRGGCRGHPNRQAHQVALRLWAWCFHTKSRPN